MNKIERQLRDAIHHLCEERIQETTKDLPSEQYFKLRNYLVRWKERTPEHHISRAIITQSDKAICVIVPEGDITVVTTFLFN